MNKVQALEAIKAGHRLTHRAFTIEEFLEFKDGQVVDQTGGFFGDQWATPGSNPMWDESWEYWVSPAETPAAIQTGVLRTLLNKIMGSEPVSPAVTLRDDCYRTGRSLRVERVHLSPNTEFTRPVTIADYIRTNYELFLPLGASSGVARKLGEFLLTHLTERNKGTIALESETGCLCFVFDTYYLRFGVE